MNRRTTSQEERRLFEQTFREARPIKAVLARPAMKKKVRVGGPSGVNGATAERLRRGLIVPEARIDLHGMTQEVAHRSLFAWLADAHRRGHRLVLVITGKGNPRKDAQAPWMMPAYGVLKQMVPHWLHQPELARWIANVTPAHARHGGDGALYIYLRKPS